MMMRDYPTSDAANWPNYSSSLVGFPLELRNLKLLHFTSKIAPWVCWKAFIGCICPQYAVCPRVYVHVYMSALCQFCVFSSQLMTSEQKYEHTLELRKEATTFGDEGKWYSCCMMLQQVSKVVMERRLGFRIESWVCPMFGGFVCHHSLLWLTS